MVHTSPHAEVDGLNIRWAVCTDCTLWTVSEVSNLSAISWREQVTFRLDDVCLVDILLYKFLIIILIPSQPVLPLAY